MLEKVRRFLLVLPIVLMANGAVGQSPEPTRAVGQFVGPGSCSASACHGSIRASATEPILQNEYSTWILKDRHARAFQSLQTPLSQRMARILAIGQPEKAPKCLACHAVSVPAALKARDFELSEGVSCESCHGPASGWLGEHILKGWKPSQSFSHGLIDTRDPIHRSDQCLTCHLGTSDKSVDHEMIAAGHPDLVFELDSYSAVMPPHWKKSLDPSAPLRSWTVGQAVNLRNALLRLERRAESHQWPEYSELDCYSCHHGLTASGQSWRQERGYRDRRAGTPPWNTSHYAVFRVVLRSVDATMLGSLDKDLDHINRLVTEPSSDRTELSRLAKATAANANQLAQRLNTMSMDASKANTIIEALAADADEIANQDAKTAEQAAMAIEALFAAQGRLQLPAVRAVVDDLFRQLQNPSAYSAPEFASALKRVAPLAK